MKFQISKILIVLLLTIELTTSIYLPLVPRRPRCMMVYTIGQVQTVKFDIVLPQIPNQSNQQNYMLTLRNTETEQVKMQKINFGSYKKQHELTPNIIYEFCIQVNTDRPLDNIHISYSAETVFHIDHSQMKVPDNLLKKEDFKGTYQAAYRIGQTIKTYGEMQKQRDIAANNNYYQTKNIDQRLITISIIQIAIIVVAGIYQYYSLQNYLSSKQYI